MILRKIDGSIVIDKEFWSIKEGAEFCVINKISLQSANLRLANLRSADLWSADLRSADLCLANLCSADLRSANLRSANLWSANLCSANLCSANLKNIKLSWTSHELIGEVLFRAAETIEQEMLAAFISKKRVWCWSDFLKADLPETDWALNVLKQYEGWEKYIDS